MLIELARPLEFLVGRVSQWFGENPAMYAQFKLAGHNGLDYACPEGSRVLAAHAGVLRLYKFDAPGYGLFVRVRGAEYETIYAHLSELADLLDGAAVWPGQTIGLSGNSGNSTGPHLHLGLRVHNMRNPAYSNYIDPVPFRAR